MGRQCDCAADLSFRDRYSRFYLLVLTALCFFSTGGLWGAPQAKSTSLHQDIAPASKPDNSPPVESEIEVIRRILELADQDADSGRLSSAAAHYNDAVNRSRSRRDLSPTAENKHVLGTSLLKLAIFHQRCGNPAEALELYDKVVELGSERDAKRQAIVLKGCAFITKASTAKLLQDFQTADACLRDALEVVKQLHDPDIAPSNTDPPYYDEFQFDEALLEAEEIDVLHASGRLKGLSERANALVSKRRAQYQTHPDANTTYWLADNLRRQAKLAYLVGQANTQSGMEIADGLLDEALELLRKYPRPNEGDLFGALHDSAIFKLNLGNHERGEQQLNEAIKLFDRDETRLRVGRENGWIMRTNLATWMAYRREEVKTRAALILLESILSDQEAAATDSDPYLTDRQRRAFRSYHRWTLGIYLSLAEHVGLRATATLYDRVLRYKAGAFLSGLARPWRTADCIVVAPLISTLGVCNSSGSSVYPLIGEVAGWTAAVKRQYVEVAYSQSLMSGDTQTAASLREASKSLDRLEICERLLDRLSVQPSAPEEQVSWTEVARRLPPNAILLDFFDGRGLDPNAIVGKGESRLWLFVIWRDTEMHVESIRLSRQKVIEIVRKWRETAASDVSADARHTNEYGAALAEVIWRPATTAFLQTKESSTNGGKEIRNAIISPDGALWQFPFTALRVGSSGTRYLIQECRVYQVFSAIQIPDSATTLHKGQSSEVQPIDLLVCPNGPTPLDSGELRQKIRAAGSATRQLRTIYDDRASFDEISNELGSGVTNAILVGHIIGGKSSDKDALAKTIEVSPLELERREDFDTYFELPRSFNGQVDRLVPRHFRAILRDPPRSLGIVACGGDAGVLVPGEGAIGFPRAAQMAGIETVWTTRWPVRLDWQEKLIPRVIERSSSQEMPIAEALRTAICDDIMQTGDGRSHPKRWGAWVLFGGLAEGLKYDDTHPVQPKTQNTFSADRDQVHNGHWAIFVAIIAASASIITMFILAWKWKYSLLFK